MRSILVCVLALTVSVTFADTETPISATQKEEILVKAGTYLAEVADALRRAKDALNRLFPEGPISDEVKAVLERAVNTVDGDAAIQLAKAAQAKTKEEIVEILLGACQRYDPYVTVVTSEVLPLAITANVPLAPPETIMAQLVENVQATCGLLNALLV